MILSKGCLKWPSSLGVMVLISDAFVQMKSGGLDHL